MKAGERKLAFYMGAGLSMSTPTDLPSGATVQEKIATRARQLLGVEVESPEGAYPTLEELGDAAESIGEDALERLRALAADAIDFVHVLPNFAHEVVALLLREGVIEALSVNWDCGIENAARGLDFEVDRILRQEDRRDNRQTPRMDKLNGCASRPETLRITNTEVDQPLQWAAHRVGAVLTDTTVIFIGLGTVGAYVAEGVERVLEASRGRTIPVLVVSPSLSDKWKDALGEAAESGHISQRAEPFLDDLTRAIVLLALTRSSERALRWAESGLPNAASLATGAERLRTALLEHEAMPVWRWWRDGAGGRSIGHPFILNQMGETAFATACAMVGDAELRVSGQDDALVVELPDRYLEICSWPGESSGTVMTRQIARVRRRRRANVYTDPGKRVVNIAVGHDGLLPAAANTVDIGDPGGSPEDIFDGPDRVVMEWVPADSFAQGTVIAPA